MIGMFLAVETPGREIFLNFGTSTKILFYVLATASIGIFTWGFYARIRKYRRGRPLARLDFGRFIRALGDISSNRTIAKRNRVVGVAHFFVFWGFVVLLIGTTIIAIDVDVIGIILNKPEWQFWNGVFYSSYALILDVFGIGFVGGLLVLARVRSNAPDRLNYSRVDEVETDRRGYQLDDRAFLGILLFLGISGFLLEGFRIAATDYPDFEVVSIAGWTIAWITGPLGQVGNDLARTFTWWAHGLAALVFVAYLPYSKGMHVINDAADLAFTEPRSAAVLAGVENPTSPGYQTIDDFTWKDLLDLDACTKCGRCHLRVTVVPTRSDSRLARARRRTRWPADVVRRWGRTTPRWRDRGRGNGHQERHTVGLHNLYGVHGGLPGRYRAHSDDRPASAETCRCWRR